jgi:glycerol uptake facilitator-like aquaporin
MTAFPLNPMKAWARKIGPLLLAFLLGIAAKILWDQRHQIWNFLADPFIYYQD